LHLKITQNNFASQQKENHGFLREGEDRLAVIENLEELPPVISAAEAADCLRVHPNAVCCMIRRGKLPACRRGKAIRISKDSLILVG
jgi:excisionase family DNA binding protein